MTFSKTLMICGFASVALMSCDGRRDGAGDDSSTFRVERVSLESSVPAPVDASGEWQSKSFQFKACLTDALSLQSIKNVKFAISDGSREIVSTTNDAGCLFWTETHGMHQHAERERFMQYTRQFRGIDLFKGTVSIPMALDPWSPDYTAFLDLHVDGAVLKDYESRLGRLETVTVFALDTDLRANVNPNVPFTGFGNANDDRAGIFVSKMLWKFTGLDKSQSKIDSLLTLKTVEKFEFRFDPKVVSRNQQNVPYLSGMTVGRLSVQVILVRDDAGANLQASDIVAHYGGELTINPDGTVARDILLRIDNLAAVLNRNLLYLIVQPVGEAVTSYKMGIFKGHVDYLQDENGNLNLSPLAAEDRPEAVAQKLQLALAQIERPVRALDLFAHESNVTLESTGAVQDIYAHLKDYASVKKMADFCDRLYTAEQMADSGGIFSHKTQVRRLCKSNPRQYVVLTRRDFVEQVTSPARYAGGTSPEKITIGRSLGYSRSQLDKAAFETKLKGGFSFDLGLGMELGPLAKMDAKIGISHETYTMHASERTREMKVDVTVADDQTLQSVSDTYEIDVTARTCTLMGGIFADGPVFYACDDAVSAKTARETYYVVRHNVESSPFTDNYDANASQWRLVIRGNDSYQAFLSIMTANNTVLNFTELTAPLDMESSLVPAFQVTQPYPGMLAPGAL